MPAQSDCEKTFVESYEHFMSRFNAKEAAKSLAGDLDGGINAYVECCGRYAAGDAIALRWHGADGESAQYTFAQLDTWSAQFAAFLTARGIGAGDVVAGLLPRTPELVITVLGTLRAGAIYQPLFTAFGPKSIEYRLERGAAKLLVTDDVNFQKLAEVAACPYTLVVKGAAANPVLADFWGEINAHEPRFMPVMRDGNDGMLLLFTSGTTGPAKGVPVPLKALLSFRIYMQYAIGLREDDVFWNVADPGWAYGLYYAIIGPLLLGHATTLYQGSFTPESTYAVIEKYQVTNLAGSPTAFRLLMAADRSLAAPLKGKLRVVNSAGEPLNPEVIRWFREEFDAPIFDHYGQTEVGMVLCNHHALTHPLHIGSAGLPLPGYRLAILGQKGAELAAGETGVLAVDVAQSPLYWFRGYLGGNPVGKYHSTGDMVEQHEDGSISFVGRDDDIITSSGYRIGPFDVESALLEHPAVSEAAVVGKPDPERTEVVKAFVVLRRGYVPDEALLLELQQFVKRRLAAHAYPREIEFMSELPKTPSGKIQRFLLRARDLVPG